MSEGSNWNVKYPWLEDRGNFLVSACIGKCCFVVGPELGVVVRCRVYLVSGRSHVPGSIPCQVPGVRCQKPGARLKMPGGRCQVVDGRW